MSLNAYELEVLNMSHCNQVNAFHTRLNEVLLGSGLIGCNYSKNPFTVLRYCDMQKLVVIKQWNVFEAKQNTISYGDFLTNYSVYKIG